MAWKRGAWAGAALVVSLSCLAWSWHVPGARLEQALSLAAYLLVGVAYALWRAGGPVQAWRAALYYTLRERLPWVLFFSALGAALIAPGLLGMGPHHGITLQTAGGAFLFLALAGLLWTRARRGAAEPASPRGRG